MKQARTDKRTSPRSDLTKRKISDSLSGVKQGSNEFTIVPEDGAKLRKTITEGDLVLVDGVEMEITLVFPAGSFFARDNEGEENEFDFEDIG